MSQTLEINNLSKLAFLMQHKYELVQILGSNYFLEKVLRADKRIFLEYSSFDKEQAELIVFAFSYGATRMFGPTKNPIPISLRTLNLMQDAVKKQLFPPDDFIRQVVISYRYFDEIKIDKEEKAKLFYDLVIFALEQGANVNTAVFETDTIAQYATDFKVFNLLERNGAKCGIISDYAFKIIKSMELTEADFRTFPKKLSNSLLSNKNYYSEIPKYVHYIWISNKERQLNLENILKSRDFFYKQMFGDWSFVIWTNDKNLIPDQEILEKNKIEVRLISDYQDSIRLTDIIIKLIAEDKVIIAADLLKISIIEFLGGVYADSNYVFLNPFNFEIENFDFFSNSLINNFFIAKPYHPVITKQIDFFKKYFNDEYKDLLRLKEHHNKAVQTMLTTAYTFAYSVIKYLNTEDNIDFVNPRSRSDVMNFDGLTCYNLLYDTYFFADLQEYCSDPEKIAGYDLKSGWELE